MIKAIFEGKKELFKGTSIDPDADKIFWEKMEKHSVIWIEPLEHQNGITCEQGWNARLVSIARDFSISVDNIVRADEKLERIIKDVGSKFKSLPVVLIDEYDRPILNCIKHNLTESQI